MSFKTSSITQTVFTDARDDRGRQRGGRFFCVLSLDRVKRDVRTICNTFFKTFQSRKIKIDFSF